MTYPFGVTATLITRTTTGQDSDGNDVETETSTVIPGCALWWGVTAEQLQGRDTVTTDATLIVPAGTSVGAIDAVVVAGQRFEVTGTPSPWSSPFTGWAPGIEVRLHRVEG